MHDEKEGHIVPGCFSLLLVIVTPEARIYVRHDIDTIPIFSDFNDGQQHGMGFCLSEMFPIISSICCYFYSRITYG